MAFLGHLFFAPYYYVQTLSTQYSTTHSHSTRSFAFSLHSRPNSLPSNMPRLSSDPNLNICPNYADDTFINTRLQLTNENITEAQAIVILRNIWQAGNTADKAQWQAQREEDRERQENIERLEDEEQARQEQDRRDEDEAARKEDRKKNKYKYTVVPDLDVPLKTVILPSSYATRKLDKGDYVELWYFTNDGLDDAKLKSSVDEDAMIMATLTGGDTAWVSAASTRNAGAVIDDQNLTFEDFCQACPRIITAMQEASWPVDRVTMMAMFWRNLQVHDFRSMRDPQAQKALLVYQAEQRKRWHIAVKSAAGAYDLSRINEVLLERTRANVYLEERTRSDNKRDYRVSVIFSERNVNEHELTTYIPYMNIPIKYNDIEP